MLKDKYVNFKHQLIDMWVWLMTYDYSSKLSKQKKIINMIITFKNIFKF